ncbi:SUF system NifU family Fe-S cluster assembly protein [Rhodococcus sp. SRB_17]|nr:SUF system NifU family Fe-S cluster assembly protein [Rhodococcus sp. SRB_17]
MTHAETDLYQDVVLDHKRAPRNFGHLAAPTHRARGTNPQCGDDLSVELDIQAGQVHDIRFSGQGCAICIASASMMGEAVKGRDVEAARQLQQHFRAVLTGQTEPEETQLGKLVSLAGVRRYPSRIKCALLGWHALMHALAEAPQVATTELPHPRSDHDETTP